MSGQVRYADPGQPTMKAVVFDECGKPDVLKYVDVQKAPIDISSDHILIKVYATSVNPIDWKLRSGEMRPLKPSAFPAVVGRDVSGVVEHIGHKVTRFAVGDEVYGMADMETGTYSEYVAISERCVVMKPKHWSHEQAAAIPLAALTAWQAIGVHLYPNPASKKVLVLGGSGGVGTLAVRLFSAVGATVYATASTDNVAYVKELGATRVFDYKTEDFDKMLGDEKLDLVLDTVGRKEDRDKAYAHIVRGGVESTTMPIDPSKHGVWAVLSAVGETIGKKVYGLGSGISYTPMLTEDFHFEQLEKITQILLDADYKVRIDETFPINKMADAHRKAEEGHTVGKIVITVSTGI